MKNILFIALIMLPFILNAKCSKYTEYQITTGGKTGTYYQIGKNLAKFVAPEACIKLEVLNSNGSMQNAKNLRSRDFPKLKFAIVQNDVLQELKKASDAGDAKAKNLVDNLRVLSPLYNEEIHIISKVGSGIKEYGDLKGKTISIGKPKSGTAMTSLLLYKELFGKRLKKYKLQNFDDALLALNRGEVDAIIKVGGQPLGRLSTGMSKEMSKYIQLVKYDKDSSKHNPISSYYSEKIKKESYPWLSSDTPTLSTKAFLITFNYSTPHTKKTIKKFLKSLKKHLPEMQKSATANVTTPHLKWKQVSNDCAPALPGGWKYYSVIDELCGISCGTISPVSNVCRSYTEYQITTGGKTGTYYQIGKNLAKCIAPEACIKLEVLNSNGSMQNAKNLRSKDFPKLKFAIVQNDVLQELKKASDAGDAKAKNLVDNLRVLSPLYNEEIHIISKVGSGIKEYGDLKGKTISIGKPKSGTAMTSLLLYKELFGKRLTKYKLQNFDDALLALNRGEVDAIIKVGGQPLGRLSTGMSKEMSKYIQLVKYDKDSSKHNPISSYYSEKIKKESYPWLSSDTPTLSTKAFLITFNYSTPHTKKKIKKFLKSLKKHLPEMQKSATANVTTPHLKWKQVSNDCAPALPGGWKYYSVIDELCGVGSTDFARAAGLKSSSSPIGSCTEFEKAAGICK